MALDFRALMIDDRSVITVQGQLDGHDVDAALRDDGQLVCSPALVERVEELLAQRRHVGLLNMAGTASLADDRLACFTLLAACDGDTGRLGGDPPRIDRIPVGAEA